MSAEPNRDPISPPSDNAWGIWFVAVVVCWWCLLIFAWAIARDPGSWLAEFLGNDTLNGFLEWAGALLTLGGFTIGWVELRRIKTAAEAAAAAAEETKNQHDLKATISLLLDAIDYLETVWESVRDSEWSMAEFSVRLCIKALTRLELADRGFDQYPGFRAAIQQSSYSLAINPSDLPEPDAQTLLEGARSVADTLQKRLEEVISQQTASVR